MVNETPYGIAKRVHFFSDIVNSVRPKSVLEMGCGTGTQVSLPLARLFPAISFLGVDCDSESISYAAEHNAMDNLAFLTDDALGLSSVFDLVIASEVLEHVDRPEEFLGSLRSRVSPGGHILLTVPNGYGPFELATFSESILHSLGVSQWLFRVASIVRRSEPVVSGVRDTLANSPHVNFFSYRDLRGIVDTSGLEIVRQRNRSWLCGFGLDTLINVLHAARINSIVADYLPPSLVSGWMLLLRVAREPLRQPGDQYVRNRYARLRRNVNLRRAGLLTSLPD